MARPRDTNRHLPKYVYEHHGAWWFRPPSGENTRICEIGDYPIKSASHGIAPPPLIRQGVRPRQLVSILHCWALDWAANPATWMRRSHHIARQNRISLIWGLSLIHI